jgi:hypothetical protein
VAEDLAVAAANAARLTAGGAHKAPAAVPLSTGGSWSSAALQVRVSGVVTYVTVVNEFVLGSLLGESGCCCICLHAVDFGLELCLPHHAHNVC